MAFLGGWGSVTRWYWPDKDSTSGPITFQLAKFDDIAYGDYAVVADTTYAYSLGAWDPNDSDWKWHGNMSRGIWQEMPTDIKDPIVENQSGIWPRGGRTWTLEGKEYHAFAATLDDACKFPALRSIFEQKSYKIHFPSGFDWVATPVDVTYTLYLTAGIPILWKDYFAHLFSKVFTPQCDETGYYDLTISGDISALNGTHQINPTTVYNSAGHTMAIVLGTQRIQTAGPHEYTVTMTSDLGLCTLPHCVREVALGPGAGPGRYGAPTIVYRLNKSVPGKWIMAADDTLENEFPNITSEQWWMMQNCRAVTAYIGVSAEFV